MSREIKFRAWSPKRSAMFTGSYIDVFANYGTGTDLNRLLKALQGGTFMHGGENYVLMQFTGLYDRNGKDIYEDDQLLIAPTLHGRAAPRAFYGVVRFVEGSYRLVGYGPSKGSSISLAITKLSEREVIGNVWENPGLTEKER